MMCRVILCFVLAATLLASRQARAADHLVLSGTFGGAEVIDTFDENHTFFARFVEYDVALGSNGSPRVAEFSAPVIPEPYPEPQRWTINAANAASFSFNWNALRQSFLEGNDVMLTFGTGKFPGTDDLLGEVWSTAGVSRIYNTAFLRQRIVVNGTTIQTRGPNNPLYQLDSFDLQEVQIERYFYTWNECTGCGSIPFEGLQGIVRWRLTGNGTISPAKAAPGPDAPEPSSALIALFAIGCAAIGYRRKR